MPTFTSIALENLLDRDSSSYSKTHKSSGSTKSSIARRSNFETDDDEKEEKDEIFRVPTKHIYISPALYTTPAPEPIPEGSSEFSPSPSPYIVNHKRRGGGGGGGGGRRIKWGLGFREGKEVIEENMLGLEVENEGIVRGENGIFGFVGGDGRERIGGFGIEGDEEREDLGLEEEVEVIGDNILGVEVGNEGFFGMENGISGSLEPVDGDWGRRIEVIGDNILGVEVENEGILGVGNGTSQYLDSVGSVNEGGNSIKGVESHTFISAQGEFFDAIEEFSSDGSFSSGQLRGLNIESEIRAIRLSLLEEVERRKTAEDTLKLMQNQWQQISNLLARSGLTLPALPIVDDESLEQFTQEVIVTKFVAEAVRNGVARAEAELISQSILASKDQEISRLRDRLQYYEAVNLEMSQRNQEIVEVSRRKRQKRQKRMKWLWSCIGLSIAIGATVIASSHLPTTGKEQMLPSSGDPVGGSASSETV